MGDYEELLAEVRANIALERQHETQLLSISNSLLDSNNEIKGLLTKLLETSVDVNERYLLKEHVIPADKTYDGGTIDSTGFEKARIFCSIGFTEATSAGIVIDLYYSGHRIGTVLEVGSGEASKSAGSLPFDINRLSGFNFKFINVDTVQEVKVSMKIVLYNE